jgi:transcriptional regulator with XRE-family HTH domain
MTSDFALATCDEILRELGVRLREQRLAQSLKQSELAAMAGVSVGTVKKLEHSGVSSLESVVRVVQALGLSGELQGLFLLQRQSIAQMALAEKAKRQRAPRSKRA